MNLGLRRALVDEGKYKAAKSLDNVMLSVTDGAPQMAVLTPEN